MPNIKYGSKIHEGIENISVPLADDSGDAVFSHVSGDAVLDLALGQAGYLFQGATYPEDKEVILRFDAAVFGTGSKPELTLTYAFQCGGFKKVKVCVDTLSATARCAAYGMFAYPTQPISVETIDFTEFNAKPNNVGSFFANQRKLKEVLGVLDWSLATDFSYNFMNCEALETIQFVENSLKYSISFSNSPLLSDTSIQSIINGLATVETSKTLTLHADVKAKLTQAQIDTITSKNWTLA